MEFHFMKRNSAACRPRHHSIVSDTTPRGRSQFPAAVTTGRRHDIADIKPRTHTDSRNGLCGLECALLRSWMRLMKTQGQIAPHVVTFAGSGALEDRLLDILRQQAPAFQDALAEKPFGFLNLDHHDLP